MPRAVPPEFRRDVVPVARRGEAAVDLLERDFTAAARNEVWLTPITEHPTGEGKLICAP